MEKKRRRQRTDLTGEHMFGDIGQVVLACLFFTIWVADSFVLEYTVWLNCYAPFAVRTILGAVLLIASGYLAVIGLFVVFGEVREEPSVIRKSVFGIVRHPIYLSEIGLYLAFFVMSMSLAALAVCAVAFLFLHYISRHEEKLLLSRFGDEYARYMREVGMWAPRLRKK